MDNNHYESANGIMVQEAGQPKDHYSQAVLVHGSYSYTAPNGEQVSVNYVADENGFQPILEEILIGLQKNAEDEVKGIFDDGFYRGSSENEGLGRQYLATKSSGKPYFAPVLSSSQCIAPAQLKKQYLAPVQPIKQYLVPRKPGAQTGYHY